MGKTRARRRAPKTETARAEAIVACVAHLKDLKRAHGRAPPDVAVRPVSTPARLSPEAPSSYCTSPAALCAEFAK